MLTTKNIWAQFRDLANNSVWRGANSGTPVDGTTGKNLFGTGSEVIDYVNGIRYINVGTKASPIWVNSALPIVGNGGLGSVGNAKMSYSFATDGGAIATITPANSPTIPLNAIILGGVIDITTTLTSGGAATIALGIGAGAQVASFKAATGVASYTSGLTLPIIPLFTAATYYKATAAGRLTLTVAAATLTAGKMDVNVIYVVGNT